MPAQMRSVVSGAGRWGSQRVASGWLARGVAVCVLAACGTTASADKVTLRDGTVHYGTVLKQTPSGVLMDTFLSNIRLELQIERHRILKVELDPETTMEKLLEKRAAESATAAEDAPGEAAPPPAVVKREGHALVLEVPLKGTFGQDIYPKSVRAAMDWAIEQGVTDIVFHLDSPGGEVWAAERITELMDERRDRLRFHALIKNAISASIWPTFGCDTITMAPGGTLGGAVVYRMNTGSAEVDLKMNSILAAKLGASAEARGHSAAVPKAMIVSEAEVWGVQRKDGSWELFETKPEAMARGGEPVEIDSNRTVLTLTSKQAGLYGIAAALEEETLDAVAVAARLGPWDNAGSKGQELSEQWTAACKEIRSEIDRQISDFQTDMGRLNSARTYSNAFAALGSAQRSLKTLQRTLDRAKDLEMGAVLESFEEFDIDRAISELNKISGDLRRQRRGG